MSASTSSPATAVATRPMKKLRPARKQVRVDQIDKTESVQTGKEYSESLLFPTVAEWWLIAGGRYLV
jgi:hypothetical protein